MLAAEPWATVTAVPRMKLKVPFKADGPLEYLDILVFLHIRGRFCQRMFSRECQLRICEDWYKWTNTLCKGKLY